MRPQGFAVLVRLFRMDAALVRISTAGEELKVEQLAFQNKPFPPAVREKIFELFDPEKATVKKRVAFSSPRETRLAVLSQKVVTQTHRRYSVCAESHLILTD